MKKLIIGLFSLLFSSLVHPASIKSDTKLVDKNGNATFSVIYQGGAHEGGVPMGASAEFADFHLAGKRTGLYNENDQVVAYYTFTFEANSTVVRSAFGDTLPVTYILLFKGNPIPIEKNLGTFVLNLSAETASQPEPEPEPDSTPERTDVVPAPPNVTLSRDLELYTSLELERAEQEAADLAFEEGVAAVLSQPEKYGLNASTTNLSPFVKGWCFVEGLDWVHVSSELFPFMYSEKLKSWLLIEEKESQLVYFIYNSQQWVTYNDLLQL